MGDVTLLVERGTMSSEVTNMEIAAGTSKGQKDKSKDVMANLEARVARVELAIGDEQDRYQVLGSQVEELRGAVSDLEGRFVETQGELRGALSELMDTQRQERDAFQAKIMEALDRLEEQVEEMRGDYLLLKKAVTSGSMGAVENPKIRTPDPKPFKGSRDARELDNFLWQMEQCFEAISLTDEKAKVRNATMYLTDTAALWWRRRHAYIEKGICTIDTWDAFKS